MSTLTERITKLEIWRNGNGADGAEKRIQALEKDCKNQNCPAGKVVADHLLTHEKGAEMILSKKQINLALVAIVLSSVFSAAALIINVLG